MPAQFSVFNDRPDFEVLHANIYTVGQGLCLKRLVKPFENGSTFTFNRALAYGSWYGIELIGVKIKGNGEIERYLRRSFYLTYGKTTTISRLTRDTYRDKGKSWKCRNCKKENIGSVAICEFCYTNYAKSAMSWLSVLPIVGLPFGIANAILSIGRALESHNTYDIVDAVLSTLFAVVDLATAPLIIVSLVAIPSKIAAETGIKFTVRTLFTAAGKPFWVGFAEVLTKNAVATGVKIAKGVGNVVLLLAEAYSEEDVFLKEEKFQKFLTQLMITILGKTF